MRVAGSRPSCTRCPAKNFENGSNITMVVASTEGDVVFDGKVSAKGGLMCGITYHGNVTFPMLAQRQLPAYQAR